MKTINYLKSPSGQIITKCMNGVSLTVDPQQITLWTEEGETAEEIEQWHRDALGYVDATKEEFDTLFIETVTSINELSKI